MHEVYFRALLAKGTQLCHVPARSNRQKRRDTREVFHETYKAKQ